MKCSHIGCDRTWHFTCGTRNACVTEMVGQFHSYCSKHVPDRNGNKKHGSADICLICLGNLADYKPANSIISSCCLDHPYWKDCFLHKKCLLGYTKNAGYDSMCVTCNMDGKITKAEWQSEMRLKGIFIPWSEATWEQDGRFDDQVKNKCQMPNCPKPEVTRNVYTCFVCGCAPRHLNCVKVENHEDYLCIACFGQSFVGRVPGCSNIEKQH